MLAVETLHAVAQVAAAGGDPVNLDGITALLKKVMFAVCVVAAISILLAAGKGKISAALATVAVVILAFLVANGKALSAIGTGLANLVTGS